LVDSRATLFFPPPSPSRTTSLGAADSTRRAAK